MNEIITLKNIELKLKKHVFFKTLILVVNRGNYRNYWCEWLR